MSYPRDTLSHWNQADLTGQRKSYDALGRLVRSEQDSELGVLTTGIAYQSNFIKRVTDPRGNLTEWEFQSFDQPDESAPIRISQPEGVTTTISRDVFGKPLEITRSGVYAGSALSATRHYVYDTAQRLCKQIDPESGASVFGYDAADNLIWSAEGRALPALACDGLNVHPSQRTTRSYDVMNRLTAVSYPDGSPGLGFAYAADGQPLRSWTTQGVEWRYGYNRRRLPTFEEYDSGEVLRFNFGYDALGHLSWVQHPSGLSVTHQPNALGQPTRAGNYASGAQYFPNGQLKQFSYGNGMLRVNTQNSRGLLLRSRDTSAGVALHDFEYRYDGNANVSQIIDHSSGQGGLQSRVMSYDGLDRLTVVFGGGLPAARYAYDPFDNLREADLGSRRYDYLYQPGNWRLGSIRQRGGATVWNFGYDSRGAQVSKGSQGYAFDAAQRLLEVPGQAQYYYDAQGRRIGQSRSNGTAKYSLYTRDGLQRGGPDNGLGGSHSQIYLGRQLVASVLEPWGSSTGQATYHHTDALGSPVVDTNAMRQVLRRTYHAPFGEVHNRTVDGPGYTGHVTDGNTGLVCMQARYYDPVGGRFLSVDPDPVNTSTAWNFNRYAYANNNPYRFVDLDGRAAETVWDVANIAMGVASAYSNISEGNWGSAAVDVGGVVVDTVAAALPVIPGGAGAAIKGARIVDKAAEGGGAARSVSKIEDTTRPGSVPNIKTDVSKAEFEGNLIDNGFTKSTSKDGKVNVLEKGDSKYTTRDYSKSTGGPTAESFKGGEQTAKIRLDEKL